MYRPKALPVNTPRRKRVGDWLRNCESLGTISKFNTMGAAVCDPLRREIQPDGRIRYWVYVPELDRFLRVVTLEDGETVLNAFPDRGFREGAS